MCVLSLRAGIIHVCRGAAAAGVPAELAKLKFDVVLVELKETSDLHGVISRTYNDAAPSFCELGEGVCSQGGGANSWCAPVF